MRSRGAERPDDDADLQNDPTGRRGRRFGRSRPEPVAPEEVSQEETGWLDDLWTAKEERAAIGPGQPGEGRSSKSGRVAPGPDEESSPSAPVSPPAPPPSSRPVSGSPTAPVSPGSARARFDGSVPTDTGSWRTSSGSWQKPPPPESPAPGRHTSDVSGDAGPGRGRRQIDAGPFGGSPARPTSPPPSEPPLSVPPPSAPPAGPPPSAPLPASGNAPEIPRSAPTSPPPPPTPRGTGRVSVPPPDGHGAPGRFAGHHAASDEQPSGRIGRVPPPGTQTGPLSRPTSGGGRHSSGEFAQVDPEGQGVPEEGTGRHGIPEPGHRTGPIPQGQRPAPGGRFPGGPRPSGGIPPGRGGTGPIRPAAGAAGMGAAGMGAAAMGAAAMGPAGRTGARPTNQTARASAPVLPPVVPGPEGARAPALPGRAGAMADSPSGVVQRPGETTGRGAPQRGTGRVPRPARVSDAPEQARPDQNRTGRGRAVPPGRPQPTGEVGRPMQVRPHSTGEMGRPVPGRPDPTGEIGRPMPGRPDPTGEVGRPMQVRPHSTGEMGRPVPGRPDPTGEVSRQTPGRPDSTGQISRQMPGRAAPPDAGRRALPGDVSQPIPGRAAVPGHAAAPPLPGDVSQALPGRALPGDVSQALPGRALPGDVSQPLPGRAGAPPRHESGRAAPPRPENGRGPLPGDVSQPIPGRAPVAGHAAPPTGDVSQPLSPRARFATGELRTGETSQPLPGMAPADAPPTGARRGGRHSGEFTQVQRARAAVAAPPETSRPLPGRAPGEGSRPLPGDASQAVPARAAVRPAVGPAAGLAPDVDERPRQASGRDVSQALPGRASVSVPRSVDVSGDVSGEIRSAAAGVPPEEDGEAAGVLVKLRTERRLRVISLIAASVVALVLLPAIFGIRAATRDPIYASLDSLDLPGWAATEVDDKSSGSAWCFFDCRFRERTAQSKRPFAETAKVYATALTAAGWQPWQVGQCPEQPVTDGRYSCWKRDEFTLDLWVRLPECAVDVVAAQDPASLPSVGPDGVVQTSPPKSCVGSTVSIKVQPAIIDPRLQPQQRPDPNLIGETPDPVLSDDPLLVPTPSTS